jgi:hypothetical protein
MAVRLSAAAAASRLRRVKFIFMGCLLNIFAFGFLSLSSRLAWLHQPRRTWVILPENICLCTIWYIYFSRDTLVQVK